MSTTPSENSTQHADIELQDRIAEQLGSSVVLTVTDNRRTMLSWRWRDEVLHLRLHKMFVASPHTVEEALVSSIRRRNPRAEAVLDEFIEANRDQIRLAQTQLRTKTRGRWHDLGEILDDLNRRYLDGAFEGRITWGKRSSRLGGRRSIRLGSYTLVDRLIRIHPALDQAHVPRFFVEYVVYHEMLHQIVPMPTVDGRTQRHSAKFRALEACFPFHKEAEAWEKANIDRLLA